jgi:DNA topoisomerase-1
MSKLLIVESPAKCKKIAGFLGAGWSVKATMGHIRALKEELEAIGFDAAKETPDWKPIYEAIDSKRDAIASLRAAARGATVYLGSDDDREGEAIAWHTCAVLDLDPATTPRVVFHEITEAALRAAVASPRTIDFHKFNAQQARTMLDMLIGFTLSPCLWRGVGFKPGLSAGRCQTPALRLIYDRDREIEDFEPTVTWRISAKSEHDLVWKATTDYEGDAAASTILTQLAATKPQTLTIRDRSERVAKSAPPKPFITSSLQQEASNVMRMNPKDTMRYAQTLYESGHITYMRTDNAILSVEAAEAAAAVVRERWGEEYLGGVEAAATEEAKPKKKVTKKKAAEAEKPEAQAAHEASGAKATTATASVSSQNAHEGIRPTHMDVTELSDVGEKEQRLYTMIWKRTIQSVMAPELRDVVKVTATPTAAPALLTLTTDWDQVSFAGWRILDHRHRGGGVTTRPSTEEGLDHEKKDADDAAAATALFESRKALITDTVLSWTAFTAAETRSSPQSRYTEAALIKELESRGIGRPSTYATLVETVLDRKYVEKANITATPIELRGYELKAGAKAPKETKRTEKVGGEKDKLRTTALGRSVMEWLLKSFGDMLDYDFTAAMEAQLDSVAKGNQRYESVLTDTWSRYRDRYTAIMGAPRSSGSSSNSGSRRVDFGDGYKIVVGKKGLLFVHERDGEKTRFAEVPGHLSMDTATRADAEAAFATTATNASAPEGNSIGELDGKPVTIRNGKFGYYATWDSIRINCKEDDTLESLTPRLQAKASPDTVNHNVGPYCIRNGPYGLYMFKRSEGSKKPTFVSIPPTTPWATLTVEGAEQLYKHFLDAKKAKK